jgi:hypothetical protein
VKRETKFKELKEIRTGGKEQQPFRLGEVNTIREVNRFLMQRT